jgi:hypothetical protein
MRFFRKALPEVVEIALPPHPPDVVGPEKTEWITLTEEQRVALSEPVKIDLPALAESEEGCGQIISFKAHREKAKLPGADTDCPPETGEHSAA